MAVNKVTIGTRTYTIARESLLPKGARAWTVSKRPSQIGDGQLREAQWTVWGPNFNSFEDDSGYLGIDFADDVDTRWEGACYLAPARTAVSLVTSTAGTPANVNCSAVILGPAATLYLYLGRGTKPAKVKVSDMTVASEGGAAPVLAERITSMVQSRNAAGTEEISMGMAGTLYQVITVVAAPAAPDTYSGNNESIINQIMYNPKQDSRIFGMTGQLLRGNILTGTVGMDASAWNTVATIAGQTITPTSIAVDGNLVVLGTSDGPYVLDTDRGMFFPLMPELDQHSANCKEMTAWPGKGTLIPLQIGLVLQHNADVVSIGVERYRANTSVAQGIPVAIAVTGTDTFAMVIYNPVTTRYWLVEGQPRKGGEWHSEPFSYHVIGNLGTANAVEHMTWVGTGDGARTQPALVIGQGSNMLYINYGRTNRHPDDTGYTYVTSGTLYLTELRREPGLLKDIIAAEFYSTGCAPGQTIQVAVSADNATYAAIAPAVTFNGFHRQLMLTGAAPNGLSFGYRIKPRLSFLTNDVTLSPRIEGKLTISYKVRPTYIAVTEARILLDEANNFTTEEQADTLLALWGAAPVLVAEDVDADSYYVQITSVSISEVQEQGGPDGGRGPVRIATIIMEHWPTVAGE